MASTVLTSCVVGPTMDESGAGVGEVERKVETLRHDESALAPGGRWIATATVPLVAAYANPNDAQPIRQLANPDAYGTPLVFLVETADAEGDWLPVSLPVRRSTAKARAASASTATTTRARSART